MSGGDDILTKLDDAIGEQTPTQPMTFTSLPLQAAKAKTERDLGLGNGGPILVGESNPYGADPEMALYPLPPNASGGRLQRIVMGIRRWRYVEFERHNLCEEPWRIRDARPRADALLANRRRVLILLGRKVAHAFGAKTTPAFSLVDVAGNVAGGDRWLRKTPYAMPPLASNWTRLVLLPHPSGLNRQWHEPGAYERARRLLRTVCPDVPWGELDGWQRPDDGRCCVLDTDGDGNCPVHSAPGVRRHGR